MLYSNFYFVVQRYTTEIVVQYVWGIAIAAGMLFVTELMAFMMDAQKDLPVDMGGVFRTWDLMRGRYEGIRGSVWVCILYCCIGSGGTIRGCPSQVGGLAGAFLVPHGCMGIERSGGAKWMLCLSAASSS